MSIGIPDYRLPREELNRDIDACELGVDIRLTPPLDAISNSKHWSGEYDAVLPAVGAQRSQRRVLPEDAHGVIPATTFPPTSISIETKLEGDVAVVGGRSTAMDAARSALACWRT